VEAPQRHGFGTTLIERSFGYEAGGKADLSFEPEGLVANVAVQL
jgi:two-component sensor histidine kinase